MLFVKDSERTEMCQPMPKILALLELDCQEICMLKNDGEYSRVYSTRLRVFFSAVHVSV